MPDPKHIAEINAVFDELWKERAETIAMLPALAQGFAESFMTRDKILATARACVAAIDKVRGTK